MSGVGKFNKIPERKAKSQQAGKDGANGGEFGDLRCRAFAPHAKSDLRKPAKIKIQGANPGASINLIVEVKEGDPKGGKDEKRVSNRQIPAAHVPVRPCQSASKNRGREPFNRLKVAAPAASSMPVEFGSHKGSLSMFLAALKRRFDGHQDWVSLPKFSSRQKVALLGGVLAVAILLFVLSAAWSRDGATQTVAMRLAGDKALEEINQTFARLAEGNSAVALETIRNVEAKYGDTPSLDYIFALVALHAGDHKLAEERARASMEKGELISDSLVIQSMAEVSELARGSGMRDPKTLREAMLRRAVRSNPANPFPMIELASLLRSQSRLEEAKDVLTAAKNRLHPIDTHAVVETSLLLTELQTKSDAELPSAVEQGTLPEMFASIYISLRRGRSDLAAKALEKCRMISSPDLLDYILSDPAFASLSDVPGRM